MGYLERFFTTRGGQTGGPRNPPLFVLAADLLQSILNADMTNHLTQPPLHKSSCSDFPVIQYAEVKQHGPFMQWSGKNLLNREVHGYCHGKNKNHFALLNHLNLSWIPFHCHHYHRMLLASACWPHHTTDGAGRIKCRTSRTTTWCLAIACDLVVAFS